MDKGAIKKFAINARKRLIDSVKDKAGSLGITEKECTSPIQTGEGFEVYKTQAGTENKIYGEEIVQRRSLVRQIKEKGYENILIKKKNEEEQKENKDIEVVGEGSKQIPIEPKKIVKNITMTKITESKTYTFESENEVDKFLADVKKKLLNELNENTIIKLS